MFKKVVLLLATHTFKALRGKMDVWRVLRWLSMTVRLLYSDGSSFIYFVFSFTSVYSFPGLLDAYPIADLKPVWSTK